MLESCDGLLYSLRLSITILVGLTAGWLSDEKIKVIRVSTDQPIMQLFTALTETQCYYSHYQCISVAYVYVLSL